MKSIEIPPSEQPNMSIENAREAIAELKQRIAAMGANDSEFYTTDKILEKLERSEVTPEEAVQEVTEILSGKQDYH